VQRPLATAVVIGMAISTLLTLFVLPGVLGLVLKGYRRPLPEDEAGGEVGTEMSHQPAE
jgi:hypothetical protein